MGGMIDTFRGYVSMQECDEMGHMNIQHYIGKAGDAELSLRAALGLSTAQPDASGKVFATREQHMRFHREMKVSDLVAIRAGIVETGETGMRVLMEMREVLEGRLAATFVCEAECLAPSGAPASWPQTTARRAAALMTALPDHARPRGLAPEIIDRDVSVARADALAMFESNRSAVHPYECDAGGRMGPRFFLARVSDAQGHMWARAGLGRHDQLAAGLATATVEMRFLFFKKPVAGELLVMRTGLVEAAEKTLRYRHWLFNAETGEPAFAAEGLGLLFDRETRKAVPIPEAVAKNFADA